MRTFFAAALVLLIGPSCALSGMKTSSIAESPAEAARERNPLEGRPEAARAGRKLFLRHCADCHGEDAEGRPWAPSLKTAAVQSAQPGELAWLLKNGSLGRGMPSWSRLPPTQRWQIVTYLQSLHSEPHDPRNDR